MAAHVMCLTSSGGIPLLLRQKGDGDAITFSTMASLNGVHMFLKSQNVKLLSTDLGDTTVMWKEFEECVTLIVVASGATKYTLEKFLDATFGAMVLFVGIDDIKIGKNIERLKRDIRACIPIVDRLLKCLDVRDKTSPKTDIAHMTECSMSHENFLLQACLDGYMECLDSIYGCLLIHGCLAVATEGWWSLTPVERKLLTIAISTETNCTAQDVPVFLPHKSPQVAFRLVSVILIHNVEVLALCGPSPELSEIERFAVQCWKNGIDALRASEQCYPRNLPAKISSLYNGILGYLLINERVEKFALGRNSQYTKNRVTGSHRLDTLRTFYHRAMEVFIHLNKSGGRTRDGSDDMEKGKAAAGTVKEAYLCSEYHKCHAIKEDDQIFCVLYASVIPTHTMRMISHKMLKILLADKQTCW